MKSIAKLNLKLMMIIALMAGVGMMNEASAQTTTWRYNAADNSGFVVRITTNGTYGSVTKFEFGKVGSTWSVAEILDSKDYGDYLRVKGTDGKIYEIRKDFDTGKLTLTRPDGTQRIYWLKKD